MSFNTENFNREMLVQNENEIISDINSSNWDDIPSLNTMNINSLKDNMLVRFIGMVQDMRSPEYYIDSYVVHNKITNEKFTKSGKFSDYVGCNENESVDLNDPSTVRKDVQTYYVITIPGENKWVKEADTKNKKETQEFKYEKSTGAVKRSLEDETSSEKTSILKKDGMDVDPPVNNSIPSTVSSEYVLNFPIPNKNEKSCIVRVYSNENEVKLNEIYEFVGLLSLNPLLSHENIEGDDKESVEFQTHNPPPSLIPRLNCITFKKIKVRNPLISNDVDISKVLYARKELKILFTQILLGDDIAAEYLLCYLLAGIYTRVNGLALGKFSLNISDIPVGIGFAQEIYNFIEQIIPKSHFLPLTLDNLNSLEFIPKKDYESNRLTSGLLQLSENTCLVIDETQMNPGQLNSAGLKSVQAISNIIKHQKLAYDFTYYPIEFDCDIPVLVMSEGVSFLPSDFHVKLNPDESYTETFKEIIGAAKMFLKPELLNSIRVYLTLARLQDYQMEDGVNGIIENHFVEMRKNGGTADDLHNLLVLTRLICLSHGKRFLDKESWDIACHLEQKRKERIVTK